MEIRVSSVTGTKDIILFGLIYVLNLKDETFLIVRVKCLNNQTIVCCEKNNLP